MGNKFTRKVVEKTQDEDEKQNEEAEKVEKEKEEILETTQQRTEGNSRKTKNEETVEFKLQDEEDDFSERASPTILAAPEIESASSAPLPKVAVKARVNINKKKMQRVDI